MREAVLAECAKAEQWLQEKIQEQEIQPKNVDPVLWSSDIKKIAEALNAAWKHVMKSKSLPQRPENIASSDHTSEGNDMREDE